MSCGGVLNLRGLLIVMHGLVFSGLLVRLVLAIEGELREDEEVHKDLEGGASNQSHWGLVAPVIRELIEVTAKPDKDQDN